jgi:hypothetical protein
VPVPGSGRGPPDASDQSPDTSQSDQAFDRTQEPGAPGPRRAALGIPTEPAGWSSCRGCALPEPIEAVCVRHGAQCLKASRLSHASDTSHRPELRGRHADDVRCATSTSVHPQHGPAQQYTARRTCAKRAPSVAPLRSHGDCACAALPRLRCKGRSALHVFVWERLAQRRARDRLHSTPNEHTANARSRRHAPGDTRGCARGSHSGRAPAPSAALRVRACVPPHATQREACIARSATVTHAVHLLGVEAPILRLRVCRLSRK